MVIKYIHNLVNDYESISQLVNDLLTVEKHNVIT